MIVSLVANEEPLVLIDECVRWIESGERPPLYLKGGGSTTRTALIQKVLFIEFLDLNQLELNRDRNSGKLIL